MTRLGGDPALVAAVKSAGREAGPAAKWLGAWALGTPLGDWDAFFQACKTQGLTPQVNAWLFGPNMNLVTNQAEADKRVTLLTNLMAKAKASGVAPWVMLEPETAIAGSTAYAAYWDRLLAAVRTCPGARAYWCPGIWVNHATYATYYAKQVAAADGVGLQSVKFEPRHGVTGIQNAVQELQRAFQAYPNKQHVIYDVLWSTYGGTHATNPPYAGGDGRALEAQQAATLQELKAALPSMGVDVVVYRALKDDPTFDADGNYGGWAERYAGVIRADGTRKPGYDALLAIAAANPVPSTYTQTQYDAIVEERDQARRDAQTAKTQASELEGRLARVIRDAQGLA